MARNRKAGDVRLKTFRLDQSKIDRAKRALGTKTDTETIERALDRVAYTQRVLEALDGLGYDPAFTSPFDDRSED